MFAEIFFNSAGSRVYNVAIEGTQVITNLDIWASGPLSFSLNDELLEAGTVLRASDMI